MTEKLRFYKKSHTYKLGSTRLTPVSTFIDYFFEPFNAQRISRLRARINRFRGIKGKGVKYYLNEWKELREHGTRVHEAIERHLNGDVFQTGITEEDVLKVQQGLKAFHQLHRSLGEPIVATEVRFGSKALGVAGTVDLLIDHNCPCEKCINRVVTLVDWKTTKEIKREGYKGKKGIHKLTEDMDDCNFNRYALQLSIYAYLYNYTTDVDISSLFIGHLKSDGYELIEVPYLKDLVKKMLEAYKNENKTSE